jgi:hypothetical protein
MPPMTYADALRVRLAWSNGGRFPCEHPFVEFEHSTNRLYLTGQYVCISCGLIFEAGTCPQPTTRSSDQIPSPV